MWIGSERTMMKMIGFGINNLQCLTTVGVLTFICAIIPGSLSYNKTLYAAVESETKLMKDLFKGYDSRVRPVTKPDETVHASFGISFQSMLALNEKEEHMESISFMLTAWHDGRLTWNRSNYMGIDAIKIPADQIWKPDVVSYTSIDESMRLGESLAHVYATGHVQWNPTLYLRSPCSVNLRTFPFDKQKCSLVFASNMYHGNQLNLTYWGGYKEAALDVKDYRNTHWPMIKHSVVIQITKNKCCKEPYPHMEVALEFRRNPDFYVHKFVVPALLLGILVPITLLIPPDSKERVTLGSIVVLSIILLEAQLSDVLPMGHNQLPALSIYYTLTLLWTVMSLACSIFVLNLHHRGPRKRKVPDAVRWVFLGSLRGLVCLGSESYYPLSDTEVINMRGLDKSSSHGQDRMANSSELRSGSTASKLEKDVDELTRQILLLGSRVSKQDNQQEILEEWRQVALVVDRVLFFLFFVVFLVCSVFLLA